MVTPHAEDAYGNVELTVELDATEAGTGTQRTVNIPPDNRAVTINIPPGVTDGMRLRVPGAGPSTEDGTPGDVTVTVVVRSAVGMPYPPPLSPPTHQPGSASPYPTQGLPAPEFAPSEFAAPPGYPPPGFAAPPPYGFGYPPPGKSGARRRPWLIAGALVIVLAAVIVVPRLLGDDDPVRTASGSGPSTTTTVAATTPAVTVEPPVTAAEYQQALTAVDQAVTPGFQKLGAARTPATAEQAASEVRQTVSTQVSRLREIVPPTTVETGHDLLVSALDALSSELLQTESAAGSQEVCTGGSALNRVGRSRAAEQVRAAAKSLSTAEPAARYRIGTFLPASTKDVSRRLNNGTYVKSGNRNGLGQLKIDNGNAQDAVVSIVPANTKSAAAIVFVRAKSKFTVKGIRNGTYRIYLTAGRDWDGQLKAFTGNCGFQQFDDTMQFKTTSSTYTIWSISLNPVAGGSASTSEVDPGTFPTT